MSQVMETQDSTCLVQPIERRWPGATVLVMASGPSLNERDVRLALAKADRVIAVSDSWRLLPSCSSDILYAADYTWWNFHMGVPEFPGEKWIACPERKSDDTKQYIKAAKEWGLRMVRTAPREGVSFDPALLHEGWNSGFQAVNIAALGGAKRILLLGFDCQRSGGQSHFFGEHPEAIRRATPFNLFAEAFAKAAPQLAAAGIGVINCSRQTALDCFPRATIEGVL